MILLNYFMLNVQSKFFVADNSGAIMVQCINTFGNKNVTLGDFISVVVKSAIPNSYVKKSQVYTALVIAVKKPKKRRDGLVFYMDKNMVILLDKNHNPIGSRILIPLAFELKELKGLKLTHLTRDFI